ncbi:MAG: DUF3047 domain-containing protein [Gammaproteobacteria bacterium]
MNLMPPSRAGRAIRSGLLSLPAILLGACAVLSPAPSGTVDVSPWSQATTLPAADPDQTWFHQRVGNRTPTHYTATTHQGRPALHADSDGGDSLMRLRLAADGPTIGRLGFSWFAGQLNTDADVADTGADDAVVRVILQFGGDRSSFSARDQRLSDLMQLVTGEPLPYATLIYVWDPARPVGTVIAHRRSERIRKLVVQSGPGDLGRWVDLERNVAADYRLAFGKAPVRLEGIALMTDSNNTGVRSRAWYGPLRLIPASN